MGGPPTGLPRHCRWELPPLVCAAAPRGCLQQRAAPHRPDWPARHCRCCHHRSTGGGGEEWPTGAAAAFAAAPPPGQARGGRTPRPPAGGGRTARSGQQKPTQTPPWWRSDSKQRGKSDKGGKKGKRTGGGMEGDGEGDDSWPRAREQGPPDWPQQAAAGSEIARTTTTARAGRAEVELHTLQWDSQTSAREGRSISRTAAKKEIGAAPGTRGSMRASRAVEELIPSTTEQMVN